MSYTNLMVVIAVVLLIGCFPRWGYNDSWGYSPFNSIAGIIVLIVLLRIFGVI